MSHDAAKNIAQVYMGKCQCGHIQAEHGVMTNYPDFENVPRIPGHGGCDVDDCHCPQFTWVAWEGEVEP